MKRFIGIFLTLLICLPMLALTAFAEQTPLVKLDYEQDITVVVTYSGAEPGIVLTSPSGKVYDSDDDYAAVERDTGVCYYYMEKAEAGQWTIEAKKVGNSEVEVEVFPWNRAVRISDLQLDESGSTSYTVTATLSDLPNRRCEYICYAVTLAADGTATGRREVASDSGTGSSVKLSFSKSLLPDGDYFIELEVYYTTADDTEIPTFAMTQTPFTVTGNTQHGDGAAFYTILDLDTFALDLDWSGADPDVTKWVLAAFGRDATEDQPDYYSYFTDGETSDYIFADPSFGDLRLRLTGSYRKNGAIEFEKTVILEPDVKMTFRTPEMSNSTMGVLDYDTCGRTLNVVFEVNGTKQNLVLTGADTLSFELDSMENNEVSVCYSWESGTWYRTSQRISVDALPPMLDLFGVADRIYTGEASVTIAGSTEAGAILTVNGAPCALEADGTFTVKLDVKRGDNTFLFESADASGNKTSRSLTVARNADGMAEPSNGKTGGNGFLPLLLSLGGSLICLALLALFGTVTRARCRKDGNPRTGLLRRMLASLEALILTAFLAALGAAGWFGWQARSLEQSISGDRLPDMLMYNTVTDIADILTQADAAQSAALRVLIIAAAALVLFIVMLVVGHLIRKSGKKGGKHSTKREIRRSAVQTPDPAAAGKAFCPHCGAPVVPGARFCGGCGGNLDSK